MGIDLEKREGTVNVKPVSTSSNGEGKEIYIPTSRGNDPERKLEEAQANLDMALEGYQPELRRNFSIWSLLGYGFGLTNSWFGISASLVTGISSGGPLIIIYGIIIVACVSCCIAITLSELISAMPNAGGQYYWTMKLAPPKYAPFASYMCGALAWAGAILTSASVTIAISTAVVGMYVLGTGDPNKTVETWQVFVAYEITNVVLVFFNIWERPLPRISQAALYMSLCSFIIIMIVVLVKSGGEFQSAHFVFVEFTNGTGWSSSAIAFIVGLINPNWSFSCLDAATHLAEEILEPRTQIPKAIIGTVIIGFVTSFSFSIAVFFCIKNLSTILKSNTGVPIMDIFYQVLNSRGGAIGLEVLIVLTAWGCNIASHTWQARLCWSFARDNGLPGSRFWKKVNHRTGVPVNAHLMSCFWTAVVGCIYMASTTAYNALVVGCITFLLSSYSIPTFFLLLRGRNNIKHGPFWLGKIGLVANYVVLGWTLFALVFYSLPEVMPVTAGNMNYVSVVIVAFSLYAVLYWVFRGRKHYITERETDDNTELTYVLSEQIDDLDLIVSKSRGKL